MSRNKRKNEVLTQARKESILRVAIKHFSEKGYQGTNVSEIAKELGISQGIVFWYFQTKENLYKNAFMQEFIEIKLASSRILHNDYLQPLEKLRSIISEMIKVYQEKKEGCMLILQILSNTELQHVLSIDITNVYNDLFSDLELLFCEAGASNPKLKARNFVALLDGFMIQILLGLDIGERETLVNDILHRYELV
ncbi:transcriptional regulator, TetR family [Ruminiclostridium papyrosolvens DSM 2782]|uniref:Transcriptional regulator, TetR family n=1 Tax=Ruminiclostridium papyrosolvens DSM 2782 TaxID=588581 RepID=F1TDB2_9FIRM|nr:TetR/AcrR family transcriptional regulator [Ruminiclostridium papyrosolvens]EGD47550.1 transcriptional regulator, TetR family [Ruminiclostridium papyrosolvens DSM 2782]WES36504.1 TetR/AcrR family transcriptional regulator [Ruminiclostridium papyrosolvens DSM 2782]